MLVVDQDHLVARRGIGEADAARVRPVGDLAYRALRRELPVGKREKMRELCGLEAADAEVHGVLHRSRRTMGSGRRWNHPVSAPDFCHARRALGRGNRRPHQAGGGYDGLAIKRCERCLWPAEPYCQAMMRPNREQ